MDYNAGQHVRVPWIYPGRIGLIIDCGGNDGHHRDLLHISFPETKWAKAKKSWIHYTHLKPLSALEQLAETADDKL